jgi:hypothetical protein
MYDSELDTNVIQPCKSANAWVLRQFDGLRWSCKNSQHVRNMNKNAK